MEYLIAFVFVAMMILLIISFKKDEEEDGYKKGQIDALNGKQKFTLIEFQDGTRDYYENPKPEDFSDEYKVFKIIR